MDDLILFINQIINGVQVGSIYALVALGYTMVYGIVKLINFAHGDFIMVGAYVSLFSIPLLLSMGLPAWLCVVFAVVACSLLGVLTERVAYKPLRNSPRITALITAIAVSLLLENLFMLVFSSSPKPFPAVFDKNQFNWGGVQFSGVTVFTIVVSVITMLALQMFVKNTKMGKAMRAVSEDSGASILMGINSNTTISVTFAIGSGLAAIAAVMYCSAYPLADPYMGSMLGLKAFIAAVLGGIGIIPGAMLGGFVIGLVESMTKAYISSQLADAVVFSILIIVLLVKPTGILGKNVGEKV
ncbi:amino acid/amide ABC transporter membrane protein 1 (HAAT family) [Hydrogenoanaerobacterium saccharovorans]|uniref:Amino acid/amide ABC transporter membrane protein 1, HAAT family n=1 Tax=Hydrogenoanaerobacterium saccharovorans TaxID=474960 RepID=A0A1H7YRK5_9FIRM|nr:amino acid/amide ABC transporter membrane protein 1 (HAAT family) [Hydrogenoanaerobacterium saccharovorans]SEM47839.1 amino acid/amide ABC transporter membrane protein 1, HAAT family [Hydrogenoanaerobacterium saccharovorans]